MTTNASKRRILVTGATGQIGSRLIQRLAADPRVEAVAAARTLEKATSLGVPVVKFDYDDLGTYERALEGVDSLFIVTGYTVDMLRQSKALVDAARHAEVKYIVHLGACGDDDTKVAHYGWHQLVERYIEWSGVSYTHLRPEIFMQNLLGYGGVKTVDQGVIRHYVGKARISWVDGDDVADVAAACLRAPERHEGQTYRLGYEARTYGEVAQEFTRVLGQEFRYEARPPSEFLARVLAAGADPAYMKCVFESYSSQTRGDIPDADETFDNFVGLTGKKPRSIADFATTHAAAFRY